MPAADDMTDKKKKQDKSLLDQRTRRLKKTCEGLCREWYGNNAPSAIFSHLEKPVPISEIMADLTSDLTPPWQKNLDLIRANWLEIVGANNAGKTTPLRLENQTLLMELRHPAYRMALDNAATKETMIRRINDIAGEEICTAIRFAAPGMFAPERKK